MQNTFQTTLILLSMVLLKGCKHNQKTQANTIKPVTFFDPFEFSAPYQKSIFTIEARFSECGEWGGHKENIIVSADTNKKFFATYRVFPFNCDSLDFYYGKNNLAPTIIKTIALNDTTENSIINYIQRMVKSKIAERFPGHAGNIFTIANSDSTLYIQVYDSKDFDIESYKQLVSELIR